MAESGLERAYKLAQGAMADLKAAVHRVLRQGPPEGSTNAVIGRLLGIYQGHEGHEGHIPRTILAIMESEGVVEQDSETKKWRLTQVAE
jgi:hypothetical protein